jgi:hypothetical protein
LHIWKCSSPQVTDVWNNSLINLQSARHKLDTDPELITSIITYLNMWRYDLFLQPIEDVKYRQLLELQDTIGARQLFEGWIHYEWVVLQQKHYLDIKSRQSGRWWTISLINKLWDAAWDLWEFRNAVYHQQQNKSLHEDTHSLDLKVRDLFNKLALTGLLLKDQHLETISIQRLILFPRSQKVEWLHQASLALAQAKKMNFQVSQSRQEQHRRHQDMIVSMQLTLSNWLKGSNLMAESLFPRVPCHLVVATE